VWRVRPAGRLAAILVVMAWASLVAGVSAGGAATGIVLALWSGLLVVGLAAWRWAFVPYVALTASAVVVQNRVSRLQVAYRDIESVRAGYRGLMITRAGARPVVAWAVQKSNIASWSHKRTRADEVAELIISRSGLTT
jgi:hypothetical protein